MSPAVLDALDVRALSAAEQIDALVAWEQVITRAWAGQARLLAEMDRRDPTPEGFAQEAVLCALRVSAHAAQQRLKVARTLIDDLPATTALVTAGTIAHGHATAIAETSWKLPSRADLGELERRVLTRAPDQTLSALRRSLARALIAINPLTAEEREERAREERRVERAALPDGMGELRHVCPAADLQAMYARLDAARRALPTDDPRTAEQQRSDLLTHAVLTGLPLGGLPTEQGRHPTVQILVGLDTLLGLNDDPAELSDYGPITAHIARLIATDPTGTWRRIITDPLSGQPMEYGRTAYRPPANLADLVITRDDRCRFPGCHQRAQRCDLDHCQPFDKDGPTDPCNICALCRRHHRLKTHFGWTYVINPDHTVTWTSPTGHTYTSHPAAHWTAPETAAPASPSGRGGTDPISDSNTSARDALINDRSNDNGDRADQVDSTDRHDSADESASTDRRHSTHQSDSAHRSDSAEQSDMSEKDHYAAEPKQLDEIDVQDRHRGDRPCATDDPPF